VGSRFELVIFDNDGVLVDSEPHANRVLAALLTECGVPTTYEESLRDYVGSSIPRVRRIAEERLGRPLPDDFEHRYYESLFERLRSGLQAIRGVREAIERIPLPSCVASSGSRERIELSLRLTGLLDHFGERLFSADDVEHGKPAPDLFLHAAESLGAEPGRCVVIEDSPLGIEAANAAGMTSFGYAATTPWDRLRDASGGVFTTMEQLPTLLGVA
jgi:HAD superfamily hydrolase (TIGR01509 family)